MKYVYWICAVVVIGLGIFFAMNVSIQPKAIPKIKFSQVEVPEDFGKAVFETLRHEVKQAPFILWGVTPNYIEDMELVRGFMEANQDAGSIYDVIVVEPELPYVELFASNMRIDTKNEMDRFANGVKEALAEGHRVVAIVPNIYSSKLIPGNPADRLRKDYGLEVTSFSVSKFASTKEQEAEFEPACVIEPQKDLSKLGAFGCMVQEIGRKTYRKKIENNKFSGLMEMTGAGDYLILFNRNPGSR